MLTNKAQQLTVAHRDTTSTRDPQPLEHQRTLNHKAWSENDVLRAVHKFQALEMSKQSNKEGKGILGSRTPKKLIIPTSRSRNHEWLYQGYLGRGYKLKHTIDLEFARVWRCVNGRVKLYHSQNYIIS